MCRCGLQKKNQTTPTHKPFFCHTEYCRTPFPRTLCLIWCSTMSSRGMGTSLGVLAAALVGWAWGVHPWWMCSCVSLCSYAIFIGIRGCFHVVSNMQTLTVRPEAGGSFQCFPRAPRTVLAPGLVVPAVAGLTKECLVTHVLGTPR